VPEEPKPRRAAADAIYLHEDLKLSAEGREALYHSILEAGTLDPEYLTMLVLSALIALLGLLQNSAAVIIGAMLISPLMNPILAGGLALILGDWRLGRKTTIVLGLSIAAAILVTWFVAEVVPLRQPTAEILARTNPNLLDLFIAMLSGLAGTLAMRATSSAFTIIPGVAIAVAVIPPLATVGYGLSAREGGIAAGAFLLFITNLVSIIISAALVFLLFGFRPHEEAEKGHLKLRYRIAISALVLVILSVPLVQTLRRAVTQVRTRSTIASVLERAFRTEHSSVADMTFSQQDGGLRIRATLRTTEYFDDVAIRAAERSLQDTFGTATRLDVEQILVTQGGLTPQQVARLRDFIAGRVGEAPTQEPAFDLRAAQEKLLAFLQTQVDGILAGTPIKRTGPLRAEVGGAPMAFALQLASGEPLEAQTINTLAAQLGSRLSHTVELHGQAELQDPAYVLALELPDARGGLDLEQRQALGKFIEQVAARSDLQVRVLISTTQPDPKSTSVARQIEALFSRRGLKPVEWIIVPAVAPTPPPSPPEKHDDTSRGAPVSAVALRCVFKTYQVF
jgi:uncharacterized hydrophobic protein (TIGR00271 family)